MPLSPYDVEPKEYCCPVCGEPTDFLYVNSDDEVVEENVIEETVDHGIDVSEGDDMTPIIMDVEETTEVVAQEVEDLDIF